MGSLARAISAVRLVVVVLAIGVTAWTGWFLASMPPPPPDSDGFAHGMAAALGGGVVLVSLGLGTLGIIAPAVLGVEDPLGFDRWQRRAFQAVAVLLALGVVGALVAGLEGLVALLSLLVVGFGVVCVVLLWRLVEHVAERRPPRRTD